MIDNLKNLKKHLRTQIAVADSLGSQFVYITKNEAKKCLELAEAEDTLLDLLNDCKEGLPPIDEQEGW